VLKHLISDVYYPRELFVIIIKILILIIFQKMKKKKIFRRQYTLAEDWARFKIKYKFPINLIYPGINKMNFDEIISKVDKKDFIEKKDYSQYLI